MAVGSLLEWRRFAATTLIASKPIALYSVTITSLTAVATVALYDGVNANAPQIMSLKANGGAATDGDSNSAYFGGGIKCFNGLYAVISGSIVDVIVSYALLTYEDLAGEPGGG